jgi:DNA-binding response OmpR family regulator
MTSQHACKPINALIVGRAEPWRERAAAYLRTSAVEAECASSESSALSSAEHRSFDVLLVDLHLPAEGGFSVCRRMAGREGVRIIAVGAGSHEADAVVALELGADDYISKSTPMRELLARVHAQARRLNDPPAALKFTFSFSGFDWDLRRRQISAPDGSVMTLSSSEISLLVAFLQSRGRELSREELSELVGRDGMDVGVRAIDSHVSRLRRKFSEHGGRHLISTVYGVGYRWAGDDEAAPGADFGLGARSGLRPAAPGRLPAAAAAAG